MAAPAHPTAPRAAETLRRLELTVTRRLDGLLQGDYHGLVPGHGSESGETRPYVPGDDVRHIDWNVSARSIETHVRETIVDRELETWLLVDRSPSLDFGTAAMTKSDLATSAVGAVGFLTARTGNRLGAVLFGRADPQDRSGGRNRPLGVDPGVQNGLQVIPARPGRDHLLAILHQLVTPAPAAQGPTTALGAAMRSLLVPPRRRGLVVVVSDFLSSDAWDGPMRSLANRHEMLAVPTDRRTRQRYAAAAAAQRADIATRLRRAGVGHLQLRTDRDWVLDIVRWVGARKQAGVPR